MKRIPMSAMSILAFAAIAGCSDDPTGPGAELITSPATVSALFGGPDSQRFYRIVVPAGAARLAVTTSGIGNVDLYVQKDQRPTVPATGGCASTGIQASESCTFDAPAAGTYFIALYGADSYNNVTLRATVTMQPT